MGRGVDQPRAALTAASETNHIGFGPCFIDEDQPGGLQAGLALTPFRSSLGNVRSVLLRRVQGLFFSVKRNWVRVFHINLILADTSCVSSSQVRNSFSVASGRAFTCSWIAVWYGASLR